jgi:hypothetical protein
MSMIEIDKGIPVAPEGSGRAKYPWSAMEIGDSFVTAAKSTHIHSMVNAAGKRYGFKFVCRRTDQDSYRIWRIA